MMRLGLLARGPIFMAIYPFGSNNHFDKPANSVIEPLKDELGWDRVKKIFCLNEEGALTKELTSIINITTSGVVIGTLLGGMMATKSTVDNFIANNEATRFISHFDARWHLQQSVMMNFIRKGARLGGRLGLFCCMFSTITTCITAYRGRLEVENYIAGASITGLLFKMNLGFRGALVGMGLGGMLGAVSGTASVLILKLSGVTIDEILEAQHKWITSRDESVNKKIKERMTTELTEVKQLYEENKKLRLMEEKQQNVKAPDT